MSKYDSYKKKVMACTAWLSLHGYFGTLRGTGGNVSVRIEGEPALAVTPSSRPYRDLSFADICIVDFDLEVIEGDSPPSVETGLHVAVYRHRLDINAVVHSHQVKASALSLINQPIPPLYDEVVLHLGGVIDIVPYAFSGTPELIDNVARKLGNHCHGYILQNHGALSLGESLDDAWRNVELLEKTAETYLAALSTGREVVRLPGAVVSQLVAERKTSIEAAADRNKVLLKRQADSHASG
ncbi:MAG: class II aldolase/adducin family protein [Desulfobacterales bacterium]|nr:class II aldolase/adducin family protein [Desulfobacterales bacterium]